MGVKISKQEQALEQRANYLKSVASEASDYIDNYDGSQADVTMFRQKRKSREGQVLRINLPRRTLSYTPSSKASPKAGLDRYDKTPSTHRAKDSSIDKIMEKESPLRRIMLKKRVSEIGHSSADLSEQQINLNLEPVTPMSFLKQNKGKMDEEIKVHLNGVIAKRYQNLINTRIYMHSELPLDDEKPMEEKSYKTIDVSKNLDDLAQSLKKFPNNGEDAWDYYYENNKQHLIDIGIAVTCRKGEATDSPNQDNYFAYVDPYTKVYSVYDGHGPYGNIVAYHVCVHVAKSLLEEPIYLLDPAGAIKEAIVKAENYLKAYVSRQASTLDTHLSGTCVTVVVQRGNMLYIGQLGDSKVMIGRKNKNKKGLSLDQLTYDHVPFSLEEKKRIYAKGGEVRIWNGEGDERVFAKGRVYPCLATTRSIGDDIGALIGIISEPEISTIEINSATDVFLLVGTSPVFTYLDDNEILNVMNYANVTKIRETADILVKKAKNAWLQNENTFEDMTLIISYF